MTAAANIVDLAARVENAQEVTDWPDPMPLIAQHQAEPYPIDALPKPIAEAVREVCEFVQSPPALAASSALSALSLACQAHADAQRAVKLEGPISLFMLTIADSGERKTTCDGYFLTAIREHQRRQAEAMEPEITDYKAAHGAWRSRCEGKEAAIRAATAKGNPTKALEQDLKDLHHDEPVAPKVPRMVLADDTPEKLAESLAKIWPSAGVMANEAGVVLGSHGMGKDSAMRNMGLLNLLWDGGEVNIGRKTAADIKVRGARLTMGLMVQSDTLREFFRKDGGLSRGIGFLARFLVARPKSTQGTRLFKEPPADWPKMAAFNRRITELLQQPPPMRDDGTLEPAMLTMAPDAKSLWITYHNVIEGQLGEGGHLCDVCDVASKSADNMARLAALFHIFKHGPAGAIGKESIDQASRIAAWYLDESRRFFGELALPAEMADASRLDGWLINQCNRDRVQEVRKNHARQYGPLRDAGRLDAAIHELAELNRLALKKDGKTTVIRINPALLDAAP
jgi:putative DNA primase/helicase